MIPPFLSRHMARPFMVACALALYLLGAPASVQAQVEVFHDNLPDGPRMQSTQRTQSTADDKAQPRIKLIPPKPRNLQPQNQPEPEAQQGSSGTRAQTPPPPPSSTKPPANETTEEKGLRIAREAEKVDEGWGDAFAAGFMILRDAQGTTSRRRLEIRSLEGEDGEDKSIIIFSEPFDIAGTALLTHSHTNEDDDQWLYLPAVARVKRISSSNKSGSFVGSEFSYEDFAGQAVEKFTYRWLRDETYKGFDVWVVARFPKDEDSGYTKEIAWIDKKHYRTHKVDFYDRKNSHLKTFRARDFRLHRDKHWRAYKSTMENHQNGKSTDLLWERYEFKIGLSERDFTKTSLRRARTR